MTFGHRVVQVSLFFNVTLALIVLRYVYSNSLQEIADLVFNRFIPDPNLRIWAFYALLYGVALIMYMLTTSSISRNAVAAEAAS